VRPSESCGVGLGKIELRRLHLELDEEVVLNILE
jgi:hypothetical protein